MIDHEFGPPYEHSELDLCGKWDSADSATIGFLVARDENRPDKLIGHCRRSSELILRFNKIFFSTTTELRRICIPATAETDSHIQPSELYLEEPTDGVMLIQASGLFTEAEEPMEECLAITADIYGDLMFER